MTTEAQIQANRANAQQSTGPRTPEGKEKAAQNALKHGLFTRETVIRGEDEGEFAEHRENLLSQLIPGTPLEETLAERVVDLSWRLKRAARDQEKAFVVLYAKHTAGAASGTGILPVDSNHRQDADATKRDAAIGWMIVADFNGEGVLDRLLRYERRIESSMYRALNELRRVHDQAQKAKQETLETRARWKEEDWESKRTRVFASSPSRAGSEEVPSLTLAEPASPLGPLTSDPGQMCKTNPICGGPRSTGILPVNRNHGQDAHATGYAPIFRPRG